MEDELITARVFTYEHEARLFAAKLESEGIECFMDDNFITSANPFLSNAVGGIKVNIKVSDVELAKEIINQIETPERKSHIDSEQIEVEEQKYLPVEGYCPKCDSEKVYQLKKTWLQSLWAFFTIIMFFIPSSTNRKMHCAACNRNWET